MFPLRAFALRNRIFCFHASLKGNQIYTFSVKYTKNTVDSVFRALWLATQTPNIQCYSLVHLQLLRATSHAKLA